MLGVADAARETYAVQDFCDLQSKHLADYDLRAAINLVLATFDNRTAWPPPEWLPPGFDPAKSLEMGMEPGLGIRELHAAGITGKGVKVAIIDQPLLENHEEYQGKVARYTKVDFEGLMRVSMHGRAVASLLVGTRCGVAPEASLYYWGVQSAKLDYALQIRSLEQILEYNSGRQETDRIRVMSVSWASTPPWRTSICGRVRWRRPSSKG